MKKKYIKDCYIRLKYGILKSYYFTDEFIKENEQLIKELDEVWEDLYKQDICVFGAVETHKENKDIKERIFNIVEKFFNLNIEITNDFTEETYKTIEDIRKYLLEVEY